MGETILQSQSSTDNIKEIAEIKRTSEQELKQLNLDIFYKIEGNNVTYNLKSVSDYLKTCKMEDFNKYYGTPILAMQICLEASGFDIGKIDGIRGPKFIQGVRRFQQQNGLPVTGKIDQNTFSHIQEVVNSGNPIVDNPIIIPIPDPEHPTQDEKIEYDKEGFRNLKQQEFADWFEKDNFKQKQLGDCWMLAGMDSLIHFGNYKKLIMNSVRINDAGDFQICLPLTLDPQKTGYIKADYGNVAESIATQNLSYGIKGYTVRDSGPREQTKKHIFTIKKREYTDLRNQRDIIGSNIQFAETEELGLRAFLIAYSKFATHADVDNKKMEGGRGNRFFRDTIEGVYTYKTSDKNDFEKIIKNFNPQTDLLNISVYQKQGYIEEWLQYSDSTHAVCIEKTYKKNGQRFAKVSNPRQGNHSREVSLEKIKEYCVGFRLGSTKSWDLPNAIKDEDSYSENNRTSYNIGGKTNPENQHEVTGSITHLIEKYGEDPGLRDERGVIKIVEKSADQYHQTILVESWGCKTEFTRTEGMLTFPGDPDLIIPLSEINLYIGSPNYGKVFFYGAKIANLINKLCHYYMIPKKGGKDTPFSINSDHELAFDHIAYDNTNDNFFDTMGNAIHDIGRDIQQGGIRVLKERTELGLQNNDTTTQNNFATYLNGLYKFFLNKTT